MPDPPGVSIFGGSKEGGKSHVNRERLNNADRD